MRTELSEKRLGGASRGAALVFAALLAALSLVIALGSDSAPAQSSVDQIESATSELQGNQSDQGELEAQIEQQNAQIDELIAQEAEIRAQEEGVAAELADKQAELDAATAELVEARQHLAVVEARLERARVSLRELLVQMYKSTPPDIVTVLLEAQTLNEAMSQAQYLQDVEDHQTAVITRVQVLEDDIAATVERLTSARETIAAARDEIAAHRDELASARAQLESQHAELAAAKQERQQSLDALQDREQKLQNQVSPGAAPPGGATATIGSDGRAIAPADAPLAVKAAIEAANRIEDAPYLWGGGHGSFEAAGYDCSGAISYALHGAGLLDTPLDSTGFTAWGEPGAGNWITVYANSGHAFVVIAGLRWDTSGDASGTGPSWYTEMRSSAGYVVRHAPGL